MAYDSIIQFNYIFKDIKLISIKQEKNNPLYLETVNQNLTSKYTITSVIYQKNYSGLFVERHFIVKCLKFLTETQAFTESIQQHFHPA